MKNSGPSFTQRQVDEVRVRALLHWGRTLIVQRVWHIPPKYVWWPDPDIDAYAMRDGNPPSDRDRPRHLRGLRLELDPDAQLPRNWREVLAPEGILDRMIEDHLDESDSPEEIAQIRTRVIAAYAKRLHSEIHDRPTEVTTESKPPDRSLIAIPTTNEVGAVLRGPHLAGLPRERIAGDATGWGPKLPH